VIADSIETVVGCQGFDGIVAIGGCDKNMPGCIMGLARLNRPSVFVSEMVMVLKITPLPPAELTPFSASSASLLMCILQGVTIDQVEAIPKRKVQSIPRFFVLYPIVYLG
jgi:hypothetical protein